MSTEHGIDVAELRSCMDDVVTLNGSTKRLGDCTAEDLRLLAAELHQEAKEAEADALRYRRQAAQLQETSR